MAIYKRPGPEDLLLIDFGYARVGLFFVVGYTREFITVKPDPPTIYGEASFTDMKYSDMEIRPIPQCSTGIFSDPGISYN